MIQANELRIGNWIADHEAGGYFQIEEICKVGNQYNVSYREGSIKCAVDVVDPIPLTEDWLVKLGFEGCVNGYWCPKEISNVKISKHGVIEIYILGSDTDLAFNGIEYLHQLQNLYFALTGEELG